MIMSETINVYFEKDEWIWIWLDKNCVKNSYFYNYLCIAKVKITTNWKTALLNDLY